MSPVFPIFPSTPRPARRLRRGFTLMEAAITTVIIGVGCVAMLELLGTGTMANNESAQVTTAINLAGNVREALAGIRFADAISPTHWGPEPGETSVSQFDDLDDFDGQTFCPPIDARRNSLGSTYSTWSQSIKVESVKPDDLTTTMAHLTLDPSARPTSRVTVTIYHNGKVAHTESWIAAYADPSSN